MWWKDAMDELVEESEKLGLYDKELGPIPPDLAALLGLAEAAKIYDKAYAKMHADKRGMAAQDYLEAVEGLCSAAAAYAQVGETKQAPGDPENCPLHPPMSTLTALYCRECGGWKR